MSSNDETFFTSIGCMDGRVQDQVANLGREKFGVKFADTITEAGLVGQLDNKQILESIKKKVEISIQKHHSKGIIVHGHQECAGNPVDDDKHKQNILKAVDVIKNFVPGETEVIPVFVERKNGEWKAVTLV